MKQVSVALLFVSLAACRSIHENAKSSGPPCFDTPEAMAAVTFVEEQDSYCAPLFRIQGAMCESQAIKAEHMWLADHYPGYQVPHHMLAHNPPGMPGPHRVYDDFSIITATGEQKRICFDIAEAYGK